MSSTLQQQQDESRDEHPALTSSTDGATTSSRTGRRSSLPKSLTSEDSQTSIIHHPSSSSSSRNRSPHSTPRKKRPSGTSKSRSESPREEPAKCWICFSDESEDTPTSSRWRSPCPCALRAHEACLLDWIADLQLPGKPRRPLECPQCKSQIRLVRPIGFVQAFYGWLQLNARKSVTYISLATVTGGTLAGCWLYGLCTVYMVWGPEEASRWLEIRSGQPLDPWTRGSLSLPLIPMALIASRFPAFDGFILAVPALHAALTYHLRRETLKDIYTSATAVMYCLPIVKFLYSELDRRYFMPLEKDIMQKLRPRAGGADEARGNDEADIHEGREAGVALEVGFEIQVNQAEENQMQEIPPPEQEPGAAAAEEQELVAALAEPGADQAPQQEHQALRGVRVDVGWLLGKIVGALAFPIAAAGIGGLLWHNLPNSWVNSPTRWDRYSAGLLQTRFGRTIAGGIIFLACRDAIHFYSLYDCVRSHKKRWVLNHDEVLK